MASKRLSQLRMESEVSKRIQDMPRRLAMALLLAVCCLGISAVAASAKEVVYNNANTVAAKVNGLPNEDTYSQCYEGCGLTSAGGIVEPGGTARDLKVVDVQVDSFKCEYGVYYLESCRSKAGKKFAFPLTLKVYGVTGTDERGALLGEASKEFKIPDRPTTKVSCPATPEGKGFGPNCDVGGFLSTVTFRGFSGITLPSKAILELSSSGPNGYVNLGLEESYKEFSGGEFHGEPGTGTPVMGKNPLPEDIFANGVAESGFTDALPVFTIEAAPH